MSFNRLVDPERARILEFQNLPASLSARQEAAARPAAPENEKRDLDAIEREAFQKGFEAGEKSGLKMAEQKAEAALKRYARALQEVEELKKELFRKSEQELVELAIDIAKKLVHREILIDQKIIVSLVRVALEELNVKSKLTVFANPADLPVLQESLGQDSDERQDRRLVLKAGEGLDRGDFRIESDYGHIDGRLSEQFQEIEKGLLSGF